MLFTLLFHAFLFNEPQYLLDHTGIFRPKVRGAALYTASQRIIISDTDEHRVLIFHENKLERAVGQLGEGPGDLQYPTKLQVLGDTLYVTENNYISAFTLSGDFQRKIKKPPGFFFEKAISGWIGIERKGESMNILWYNEAAETRKVLFTCKAPNSQGFNPAPALPRCVVDASGVNTYVSLPHEFVVLVFDNRTGEVVRQIKKEKHVVPFDKEWGQRQFDQFSQRLKQLNAPAPKEPVFPKYFPPINRLLVDIHNNLLIFTRDQVVFAYTEKGAQISSPFITEEMVHRILGVHHSAFLVLAYVDEEVKVARVPFPHMAAFLEKYPNR